MTCRRQIAVTVTDLHRHWRKVLALSRRQDVLVLRRDALIAVLLSVHRYRCLVSACSRNERQLLALGKGHVRRKDGKSRRNSIKKKGR